MLKNIDITLEYFVNEVFNRWTCKKTKPNRYNVTYANEHNTADKLLCILSTNPYTNDTQSMGARWNSVGDFDLCIYGDNNMTDIMRLFQNIVQDVIYETFGISINEPNPYDYEHIAVYGRQFISFVATLQDELMKILDSESEWWKRKNVYKPFNYMGYELSYDKDIYSSMQDWFDDVVLLRDEWGETEYDGDKLIISYDDNGYDFYHEEPFAEPVNALAALIWDKLNPEFVKYTDIFGTLPSDLKEFNSAHSYEFICEHVHNLDTLYKGIDYGLNMFKTAYTGSYNEHNISEFEGYISNLKKDVETLDEALRIIKYWDNEKQFAIASGLCNLIEY